MKALSTGNMSDENASLVDIYKGLNRDNRDNDEVKFLHGLEGAAHAMELFGPSGVWVHKLLINFLGVPAGAVSLGELLDGAIKRSTIGDKARCLNEIRQFWEALSSRARKPNGASKSIECLNGLNGVVCARALSTSALHAPIVCFFLTSPHDQPNRGDTDYVMSLVNGISSQSHGSVYPIHITGSHTIDGQPLYNYVSMYANGEYKKTDSPVRTQAVQNIVSFIQLFKNKSKVLHLQLRAPETGCMIHLSDIVNLKKLVNKFFITCHEWTHIEELKSRLSQLPYIKEADHTIFLNKADKKAAAVAFQQTYTDTGLDEHKFSVSCVSSTVRPRVGLKPNSERPSNILIFGLIREHKGFEVAIQIAERLNSLASAHPLRSTKVICAGKPQDMDLVRKLLSCPNKKYFGRYREAWVERVSALTEEFKHTKFTNILCEKMGMLEHKTKIEKHLRSNGFKNLNLLEKNLKTQGLLQVKEEVQKLSLSEAEKKELGIQFFCEFAREKSPNDSGMNLPIEFYFNVSPEELDELSERCKYCVKLETKGFANNSSSIINALHRKHIVFTNRGTLTAEEFIIGQYKDALVLLPYEAMPAKDGTIQQNYVDYILDEIARRELDANLNMTTVNQVEQVICKLFNIELICCSLLNEYGKQLGVSR